VVGLLRNEWKIYLMLGYLSYSFLTSSNHSIWEYRKYLEMLPYPYTRIFQILCSDGRESSINK
jgi:hypothetical protein